VTYRISVRLIPPQLRHFSFQLLQTFSVLKFISNKSASRLFFGDFSTVNVSSTSLLQFQMVERA